MLDNSDSLPRTRDLVYPQNLITEATLQPWSYLNAPLDDLSCIQDVEGNEDDTSFQNEYQDATENAQLCSTSQMSPSLCLCPFLTRNLRILIVPGSMIRLTVLKTL